MNNFDVYVIHSSKPLDDLKTLLDACGGYTYAGIIYKSLRRSNPGRGQTTEKEETRKTIVFCPKSTIQKLEMTHPQYRGRVADYNWGSFPVPNRDQGETWDLHVSGIPKDYTVKDAETFVSKSLSCILPERSSTGVKNYVVEFATRLRETGEIYGFGHIIFDSSVDQRTIKLCKLILHNTPVPFKTRVPGGVEKRMVTCVWHRPVRLNSQAPKSSEDEASKRPTIKFRSGVEGMRRARPAVVQQVDVSGLDRTPIAPVAVKTEEVVSEKDGMVMSQ